MRIAPTENQLALLTDLPEHRKSSTQLKMLRELDRTTVVDPHYVLVQSPAQLQEAISACKASSAISVDLETRGKKWRKGPPVSLNLHTPSNGMSYFIPNRMVHAVRNFTDSEIFESFADIMQDASIKKIGQNFKYDMHFMREYWQIDIAGFYHDTMLAGIILDENVKHDLESMCSRYLKLQSWKIKHEAAFETWPIKIATQYACRDADYAYRLAVFQGRHLNRPELEKLKYLVYDLEVPVMHIACDMERRGVLFDMDYQRDVLLPTTRQHVERCAAKIKAVVGNVNLDAPDQVASAFFDVLGLPKINDRHTDAPVLKQLAGDYWGENVRLYPVADEAKGYAIAADMLEYRQWSTIDKMFSSKLYKTVDPDDGRIHCSINTIGTEEKTVVTGRMSSSDPNLQQLPKRIGPLIRRAIIPSKGCVFVSFDFSQIELRLLAHFSGDEKLIAAFKSGRDIHTTVMCDVFGITYEYYLEHKDDTDLITKRTATKNINFGILYGMGAESLAVRIKSTVTQAQRFIDKWFAAYPKVKSCIARFHIQAGRHGYVETILGRKRRLPEAQGTNRILIAHAERQAVNSPHQGSAADLAKLAMLAHDSHLKAHHWPYELLLQIHDELLYEVPEPWLKKHRSSIDTMAKIMENVFELSVPIVVSREILTRWGDKTEIDFDEFEELEYA